MIERLRFDDAPELLPPHDLAAEAAVLGSVLLDREVIARVDGIVTRRDFYRERHGLIYQAMRDLHDRAEPVDYLTLVMELDRTGRLAEAGDATYVAGLLDAVPTPIHAEHYARAVADAGVMRRLISAGGKIATLGFSREDGPATAIERAEQILLDVAASRAKTAGRPIADLVRAYLDRLELARSGQASSSSIPTGYLDLDRILNGGPKRSDLMILAARPGMGKSALAFGVAAHTGMRLGAGVAIFSLEMSAEQVTDRILASEAAVESSRLVEGPLSVIEERRIGSVIGPLAEAAIFVDDTAALTPGELRSRVRRIAAETPLDLVIVDHIGLMRGGRADMNPVQEVSEITRQLKELAKEQHVAVLALSQLNRSVEQRSPRIPILSDLRQSGSVEQDADVVVFIYRDDYYSRDSERPGVADLIVAKHRNGPTGQVSLLFNERTTKFLDLEVSHDGQRPWWNA